MIRHAQGPMLALVPAIKAPITNTAPDAPSTKLAKANQLKPILVEARANRPVLGLWYPIQQGLFKGGDGRFFSPFLIGSAQICQNRDVLKLVFEDMNVVRRTMKSGEGAKLEDSEEERLKKEEAFKQELELLPPGEQAARIAERKAKEEADKKKMEDSAYEDAVNVSKMQRFNTRVKLCVYLTRRAPKARMVDIEEAGVILLFDKGGDKFDGCLYTDNKGNGSWPYLEQGLLKLPDPSNFKGVCLVKRAKDAPVTTEPVIYGYARLDLMPDRLKPSESVLGMKEMRDMHAKTAGPTLSVAKGAKAVAGLLGKALGLAQEEEPVVDISKLKANGFYVRQADSIWQHLKKSEDDSMDFQEFLAALEKLEFYMLDPRAQRLFAACDLANKGKITIIDFQMGLMMNDVIPPETGLMPLDAFSLFDYRNEGEINTDQFREIAGALGLQGEDEMFDKVFADADKDKSGKISYDEFKAIFVKLVKAGDELKKRNLDAGLLASEERQQERLRKVLDQEEADMLRAFATARVLIEEQLTKRRLERDERRRAQKEEHKKLERLEKLMAAFKKKQRSEAEKKLAKERAKSKIEQRELRAKLEQDEKDLKEKKDQDIREQRRKKEEDRLAEIRARMLDKWDLRHNGFKQVPAWAFMGKEAESRLDVLIYLDLSENRIESLPDNFLYWMNSLRDLNLSHNRLKSLPVEIRNCARLELLNLSNNYLSELPAEIGTLLELKQLEAFKNRLTALPHTIGNLTKLRILNVHSNLITELPIEVQELQEIMRLDIGDNRLRYLPEDLSKLMTCTDLDISSNLINYLPSGFGEQMMGLKFLDASHNHIAELPPSMCRLTNLMILKLKKNQMRELDAWAGGLRSLMELDICDNEIDFVSPLLGQCTALQALRLNANRLRTLPPEVGSLEHLQLLHLHHNPLPLLLPEVRGLHSLQTLMLCNCQISGPLVHDFTSMVGLKHVDISGNAITALPENFGNLTRLKELHASRNRIKILPSSLSKCESLVHLDVSSNGLTRFPDIVFTMPRLVHIDLCSNCIEYLPQNIYTMAKHLKYLGLDHNRLRAVPPDFSLLAQRVPVSIKKNPWTALPDKWNNKWDVHSQAERPVGYGEWDVVRWAADQQCFYDAACAEWAEAGALHFTGRGTLQDFIQGIKARVGKDWYEHYVPGISKLYFMAKQHGFVPRLHQVSESETQYLQARVETTKARRQEQVALVRGWHEEHKQRLHKTYEKDAEQTRKVRSRYVATLSRFEARMQVRKKEKEAEHQALLETVRQRALGQEQRAALREHEDNGAAEEEMARLLAHARKTPLW